jgi:hypothetical protein
VGRVQPVRRPARRARRRVWPRDRRARPAPRADTLPPAARARQRARSRSRPNDGAGHERRLAVHSHRRQPPPRDDEPAFREPSLPPQREAPSSSSGHPPIDDNRTFEAPPVEIAPPAAAPTVTQGTPLRALLGNFKVRVRRRPLAVVITFTLRRRARVGLVGLRRGRTVAPHEDADAEARAPAAGHEGLAQALPDAALKFATRELDLPAGAEEGASGDDAVTTGGDTVTTGTGR